MQFKIGEKISKQYLVETAMRFPTFTFIGPIMFFAGTQISGDCKGCGFTLDCHFGCPKCRRY